MMFVCHASITVVAILTNRRLLEIACASLDHDCLGDLDCGSISIDWKDDPTGHQNVEEGLELRIWKCEDNLCNVCDHNSCNGLAY
jgi:hypothetical protein